MTAALTNLLYDLHQSKRLSPPRVIAIALPILCALLLLTVAAPRLIHEYAQNANCAHVIVTLPVAVAILFLRLREARRLPSPRPTLATRAATTLAALGLPLALLLFLLDAMVHEVAVVALALWVAGLGIVAIAGGRTALRHGLTPFILLAFAIPPPQAVTQLAIHHHLQTITTDAAAGLLAMAGLSATPDNAHLLVEGQSLYIAEPCSGYKFIIAMLFAALVFGAFPTRLRPAPRIALAVLAVLIALAINIARIALAGLITHLDDRHAAMAFLHGPWVLFVYAAGVALLWLTAGMLNDDAGRHTPTVQPQSMSGTHTGRPTSSTARRILGACTVSICLLLAFATQITTIDLSPTLTGPPLAQLPLPAGTKTETAPALADFAATCDDHVARRITLDRKTFATLHIFYCRTRQPDNRLTGFETYQRQHVAGARRRTNSIVTLEGGSSAIRLQIENDGGSRTLLYWYQSPGRTSASPASHLLRQFTEELQCRRSDGCVVLLELAGRRPDEAESKLIELASTLHPTIETWLDRQIPD